MNRVYFTADLHLGHRKAPEFRGMASLDEMHERIITAWNAKVRITDTVWVLGDVALGGSANLELVGRLNGLKKLVMGNHDTYIVEEYRRFFSRVYGSAEHKGHLLTHIPVHEGQKERYALNIHGHLHDKRVGTEFFIRGEGTAYNHTPDPWYQCVSLEQFNYEPVTLDEIYERVRKERGEQS